MKRKHLLKSCDLSCFQPCLNHSEHTDEFLYSLNKFGGLKMYFRWNIRHRHPRQVLWRCDKTGAKKQKPLCNVPFPNCEFGLLHRRDTQTHTLTTPKKPARITASFLARLRTWSAFCAYVLTSDSSLPKALTVRRLLIRSSANCTQAQRFITTLCI